MYRISALRSLLVTGSLTLLAATLGAQGGQPIARSGVSGTPTKTSGVIDGIVSDTNLIPLNAAFVSILGTPLKIGTGSNGRFRITNVPQGQYLVIVKRVGYRPTSGVIDVPALDTVRLAYMLEPIVTTLGTVVVTEKPFSIRMQEFLARKKLGIGQFMTQEQIEARNSVYPTELLRTFTSINVTPDRGHGSITAYYAMSQREGANPQQGGCPMQVYLDQIPMPTPFNLDLLPPPKDIAGIEVYSGPSTVPPQFAGSGRGCGVILVWTREGVPNAP
jgi:carboxypeptidase family protein